MARKILTNEKHAANKNGVLRLVLVGVSFILEAAFWCLLFLRINRYAGWVSVCTKMLAIFLVMLLCSSGRKTSAIRLPWIVLMLSFPVFGCTLYLMLGKNYSFRRMRRRYEQVDESLLPLLPENADALAALEQADPTAAGIARYLGENVGYPVYADSDIRYFDTAEAGLAAQLRDMAKARRFIFMEYHAIENAESWHRIRAVLEERIRAGVEVRVFYDDMGSIGFVNTDFAKDLRRRGIQCRVFNPLAPGLNMFMHNRDHRKITVIDGHVGFTGGYNLANEYFNITHPYGRWKDSGVRVEGPAVRSLTVTFLEMWNAVTRKSLSDKNFAAYLPRLHYTPREKGVYIVPFADSPLGTLRVHEDVYISMLNMARHYCWFMTPYLVLSDEMIRAMNLASLRGVDVRIVMPGIPDKKTMYSVSRSFYSSLTGSGVRIFEWTPGFCHAKLCIADDKAAVCGTANLDFRSLYHHFENGCFFVGARAAADVKADFDRTLAQCREVTDQYSSAPAAPRLDLLALRMVSGML